MICDSGVIRGMHEIYTHDRCGIVTYRISTWDVETAAYSLSDSYIDIPIVIRVQVSQNTIVPAIGSSVNNQ